MGKLKEEYFIIYYSPEICDLPQFHVFNTLKVPVDFVVDHTTLLHKVKSKQPKAIVVIGKPDIVSKLREAETVDEIPIFVFDSIEDVDKVISNL